MILDYIRNFNVVICDDDVVAAKVIQSVLAKKNFKSIKVCSSPEQVLHMFDDDIDSEVPDIVIMDTNTDTINITSVEATEIIKQNSPKTIIICISSSKTETSDISIRALASGCDSWVDKDKDDYLGRLVARASHWVSYLEERRKLAELYDSLAGGATAGAS